MYTYLLGTFPTFLLPRLCLHFMNDSGQIVMVVQPVLDFGRFSGMRVGFRLEFHFMLVLQIPHPPLPLFLQPVLQGCFLPFLFRIRAFRQQLHVVGEFGLDAIDFRWGNANKVPR